MYDLEGEDKRFTIAVGGGCIIIWPEPAPSAEGRRNVREQIAPTTPIAEIAKLVRRLKRSLAQWF